MGWLDRFRKEEKSYDYHVGYVTRGSFEEFVLGSGHDKMTPAHAMRLYQQSEVLSWAVDKVAREVEQIQPKILGPDGQYNDDHEVLEKLRQPNGYEDRKTFIGQIARHYLLTHDSTMYGAGSVRSAPAEIFSVKPQHYTVQCGEDRYPSIFHITNGPARGVYRKQRLDGKYRFFDGRLREVYKITDFSSASDNEMADSPLLALRQDIRQQIAGTMHNLRLLENGGRLSLVATVKGNVGPDQRREIVQSLREQFGGANNAGKIAVTFGNEIDGIDYDELGQSNKDMDFANLNVVSKEAVARRYEIPLPLISNDASTYNNMSTAVEMFYHNSVIPTFDKIYGGLGRFLLPRYGLDPAQYQITYNPEDIPALRRQHLEELQIKHGMGALTTNEIRDQISYEAVENGDSILVPATMVPLGTDTFTEIDIADPEATARGMVDGN